MEKQRRAYLFHFSRKDGRFFFLDPFQDPNEVIPVIENCELIGLYGNEPKVEAVTWFRNELYRKVEAAVKVWVAERRFIPRFLICSGLFLLSYLFLSLVVRDPLPMLDELLISLGVSIGCYIFLSRRDLSSAWSSKKRAELRGKVDSIFFREDQFVKEVEKNLHRLETGSPQQALESIILSTDSFYSHLNAEAASQLARYIELKLGSKELKRQEKRIRALVKARRGNDQKEIETLSRQFSAKKIDLSLFAVYHGIKSSSKNG